MVKRSEVCNQPDGKMVDWEDAKQRKSKVKE
jgi:hypothetical protein